MSICIEQEKAKGWINHKVVVAELQQINLLGTLTCCDANVHSYMLFIFFLKYAVQTARLIYLVH